MDNRVKESLVEENHDPLIRVLNKIVVANVKCLAVLMVFVIIWSLIDVVGHIYLQIVTTTLLFSSERIIETLGAFLAVLIAIEIFLNIVFYLKKDAVHVPLVLATALTAVARKVIILDYTTATYMHILATAAVILSVGISYWLVIKQS